MVLRNNHQLRTDFRVGRKSIWIVREIDISSGVYAHGRNKLSPFESVVGFPAIDVYFFFVIFKRIVDEVFGTKRQFFDCVSVF
ncbi:hypothetical protein D3C86_1140270 [compost metagenome]